MRLYAIETSRTIDQLRKIMNPGAIIRAPSDPRLSVCVGKANDGEGLPIDGRASLQSYQEHAQLMYRLQNGNVTLYGELRSIVYMPLGNHPERGLTCES